MKTRINCLMISLLAMMLLFAGCQARSGTLQAPEVTFELALNGEAAASALWSDLEYVNVSVIRFGRDGEEQVSCSGFRLMDLLNAAGLNPENEVTLTAADGYSIQITAEQAKLDTTLLVLEEGGQLLDEDNLPMLAVDGAGGNLWIRHIVAISTDG